MAEESDGEPPIVGNTKAYQNQAIALISICLFFSRFSAQGQEQHAEFKTVLRACDDVLRFAVYSGQQTTDQTNQRFEFAIETLSTYASMFHPGIDLVRARMGAAKKKDMVLYEDLCPPDLIVVNFVLFKKLPDPEPIVVQLMLAPTAGIEEVLWHFAHFEDNRRITLQDCPHFYSELPTSSDAYTGQFKVHPIKYLMLQPNETIYVLVDQLRRVFLETKREERIFTNVFTLKDVMIFQDVHGVLEGESAVGESILNFPNLWRSEKFFVVPDLTGTLAYDLRLDPIITIKSTAKRTTRDRRDLIRGALGSTYHDLYIYAGQLPPYWTQREKDLLPPAPTSERPGWCDLLYTTFDALNGDILHKIFDFCRLEDEESWNLKLRWCKLSQVCQKWRHVMHRSSSHLDMRIPFTSATRSLNMLSHLPPLPIDIDFRSKGTIESSVDVLHAIQQPARIRRIVLQVPSQTLEKLIVTMDKHFPQLEYLSLLSTTDSEGANKLIIPRTFLAPKLRHLELRGIYLPTSPGRPLPTFTHTLVTLKLIDIKDPGYFTPEDLVTQLRHTPQVEDVSIGFATPMLRLKAERKSLLLPTALTKLPALRRFDFCGESDYLESLLSRIRAPHLERFNVTISNQFTFTLPRLSHFTVTTKALRRPIAKVMFKQGAVSLVVGSGSKTDEGTFSLHINCKHFDGQILAATQVCGALVPLLSFTQRLTLDVEEKSLPPDWQNDIDGRAWRDLLGPFSNVTRLRIAYPFASELFNAMQSHDMKLVSGLLPELEGLEIAHADAGFAAYVDVRQLTNRPAPPSITQGPPTLQKQKAQFLPLALREKVQALLPSKLASGHPGHGIARRTAIALSDDILLMIFDHCRLNDEEGWNLKLRWCKLSHVCRKWRQTIHQSFFRLSMHIPFKNGTLPSDVLSHLPPLPIVIDHRSRDAGGTDAGILHAIQRRSCLPKTEPFPTKLNEGTRLMVPETFPTPNLRRRKSRVTCLLKALPLLASTVPLVALRLTDIQTPGYFAPEDLINQIQDIPQLEELSIAFSIPLPRPHAEGKLFLPSKPSAVLPSLRRLEFRGVGAYLESLLAQISAPLLEQFIATLFNQTIFSLQHISRLTKATKSLRHPIANVLFDSEGVSFVIGPHAKSGDGILGLQIRCKHFDWQMNAATQICAALEPALSVAEEVTLEFDGLPLDWRDAVDGKAWRDLFGPFSRAKQLHIVCPHAPEISASLESYRAELTTEPEQLQVPQQQYLDVPVKTGHPTASVASIDIHTTIATTASSDLLVQHANPTEPSEVIDEGDDSPPVLDPNKIPAKKNWFRRNVIDGVCKRIGSRVRAGRSSVVRLISSPFK